MINQIIRSVIIGTNATGFAGEPFVAVYEVVADVLQPQLVVDIDSANVTTTTTTTAADPSEM